LEHDLEAGVKDVFAKRWFAHGRNTPVRIWLKYTRAYSTVKGYFCAAVVGRRDIQQRPMPSFGRR
jgi:hypothetical protein